MSERPYAHLGESDRVAVFIDYGHLRAIQNELRMRVHIQTLAHTLVGDATCVHTYLYDTRSDSNAPFVDALDRQRGITVRLGELVGSGEEQHQKGVDVQLAIDVMRLAREPRDRINGVVIVTGDGDFVPLVKEAQRFGMRVFIAHAHHKLPFPSLRVSRRLVGCADGTIEIDRQMIRQCWTGRDRVKKPAAAVQPTVLLPTATRDVLPADEKAKVNAGEVVCIKAGGSATVGAGGVAIAEPMSSVHALKGAVIYRYDGVAFTGTKDFVVIPVSGSPVVPNQQNVQPQHAQVQNRSEGDGGGRRKRRRRHRTGADCLQADAARTDHVDGQQSAARRIPIRSGDDDRDHSALHLGAADATTVVEVVPEAPPRPRLTGTLTSRWIPMLLT
jgi:uncharacterized LabA/DUF88 family protein